MMLIRYWLGHVARKIVPDVTHNVLTGTLDPTILSTEIIPPYCVFIMCIKICLYFGYC